MRWIPVIALLACVCQGCFVLDELDKGQAIMEKHSPKDRGDAAKKEQTSPAARTARKGEAGEERILDDLKQWWKKVREPAPPERDPDDVVVRCRIGGSTQFTRKFDCRIRGGRVI